MAKKKGAKSQKKAKTEAPSVSKTPSLISGLLAWGIAIAVFIYAIVGPAGYMDYRKLKQERLKLEQKLAELEDENRRLQGEIERLQKDPQFLEKLARQRLGMLHLDERVVIVPK